MICVPIVRDDTLHGVIQVINKLDGSTFDDDELRVVQSLAEHAAIVVPADRLRVAVAEDLQHLVRPGIVPDEVPRDPEPGRREAVDVAEDRLEGGQVRVHVREDREAHRAGRWGPAYISRSQYDAKMSRHFAQRAAESHAIFDPSLWPIASPVMPNSRCVAKPLNQWSPAGMLEAPTKPWAIASPHRGHRSIGGPSRWGHMNARDAGFVHLVVTLK